MTTPRPPIEDVVRGAQAAARNLRLRFRREFPRFPSSEHALRQGFKGQAYINDLGLVLEFVNSDEAQDTFYAPGIMKWRDLILSTKEPARREYLTDLAATLPSCSRILNIGAGGDTLPVEVFQATGHEIVCTEGAQNAIKDLTRRIAVPAFPLDLVHLHEALPEGSFDVVFGNSTLGYLSPKKVRDVLDNVCHVMASCGVFTFDVQPLPGYFDAFTDEIPVGVSNRTDPDPERVIAHVRRWGSPQGLHASLFEHHLRLRALQLGMLSLLEEFFSERGCQTQLAQSPLKARGGGVSTQQCLRVAKPGHALVPLVPGEQALDVKRDWQAACAIQRLHFSFKALDRDQAARLAPLLGLPNGDPRQTAWDVLASVTQRADVDSLDPAIRAELIAKVHPAEVKQRLRRIIDEEIPFSGLAIPRTRAADQSYRKQAIDRLIADQQTPEHIIMADADRHIDQAYELHAQGKWIGDK